MKKNLLFIISLLMSSIVFNVFIYPTKITSGGVNCIALIINNIFNINSSIIILIINLFLLVISVLCLKVEKTKMTVISTFLYPFFVEITSSLRLVLNIDCSDLLLISIYIGVLSGISNGLMYKSGYTNCGIPIISRIISDKFHINIAKISFIINSIIVIIGGIYFGYTMVLYAVIILYINSYFINKIVYGFSKYKMLYIRSKKYDYMNDYLYEEFYNNYLIFNINNDYKELFCIIVPSENFYQLYLKIMKIDSNILLYILNIYDIEGMLYLN